MTCPECGSTEIRSSKSFHLRDVLQRVRGREGFRCRKCRHRFFAAYSGESGPAAAAPSKSSVRHPQLMSMRARKRLVRRLVEFTIFAVAFLIFWYFLRYITTEKAPAPDAGALQTQLSRSLA